MSYFYESMFVFIALNLNMSIGNVVLMAVDADYDWVYGREQTWRRWYRVAAGYFIIQLWPLWLITHYTLRKP